MKKGAQYMLKKCNSCDNDNSRRKGKAKNKTSYGKKVNAAASTTRLSRTTILLKNMFKT